MPRAIGCNELGRRVGESHHNAKLSDGDVELVLVLRAEGWGYRRLAAKFECSRTLIRKIVHGEIRWQIPTRWKHNR